MPIPVNEDIAGRLDEVARVLSEQGANRFRVQAYHQAAVVLRGLARPVSEIFAEEGLAGLEKLPGVGESIARSIRDLLRLGSFQPAIPRPTTLSRFFSWVTRKPTRLKILGPRRPTDRMRTGGAAAGRNSSPCRKD